MFSRKIQRKSERNASSSKYMNDTVNKRRLNKRQAVNEEELTSSSEDETPKPNKPKEVEPSDNENETAQEKNLRLANIYLGEIAKKERMRLENESNDLNSSFIANVLKEDYLRSIGKLQTLVADKYTGADIDNIKVLICKDHRGSITCLCITNEYIFSGSKNGTIVKWSIDECRMLGSIPHAKSCLIANKIMGHSKGISSMVSSTDGKFLAAADITKDIQIWDPVTLKHLQTFKGHQNTVTGLTFRKGTHTLYSCSKDRSVKIWNLDEMAYVETLYGHQSYISSIDALMKERAITSGGTDRSIRVWKIVQESQLVFNGSSTSIDIVKLLNEETFVSGSPDGSISVWGINKKKPLSIYRKIHGCDPVNGEPYWICSIATLINTDLIATGSQNGFIKLWKFSGNYKRMDLLFTIEMTGFVNDLVFTVDGRHLIAALGIEHRLGRWNVIKEAKNSIVKIPLILSNEK